MGTWDFRNKVVVITGGTGGLGLDLSKQFIQSGATVYTCGFHDVDAYNKEMETYMREIGKSDQLFVRSIDVRDVSALKQWIEDIIKKENKVDVLVNAAGICPLVDVFDVTPELWDDVMHVNTRSVFFATQAALGSMLEQGSGKVVNIGSTAGYNGGIVTTPAYGASKGGVHTLTKWFAAKFSKSGICFNCVVPGPFKTNMISEFSDEVLEKMKATTPNGRLGHTEDVVQCVMFLANDASSHMTGAALDVCGGIYMR